VTQDWTLSTMPSSSGASPPRPRPISGGSAPSPSPWASGTGDSRFPALSHARYRSAPVLPGRHADSSVSMLRAHRVASFAAVAVGVAFAGLPAHRGGANPASYPAYSAPGASTTNSPALTGRSDAR